MSFIWYGLSATAITEILRTFPPNRYPATAFFDSELLEIAKENAQALVLGATGSNLTSDLAVSAGHTHDNDTTRLAWRQIATFPLLNNGGRTLGSAPDEWVDAALVDDTASIELASLRLWLSASQCADVIPRVKVSNDNSATTDCTITFDFYDLSDLTTPVLSYDLVISTATARDREWVDGVSQDLSALLSADGVVTSRYPCIVFVSAALAADVEDVALHEISFGVTP